MDLKLGKAPAKRDPRSLRYGDVMRPIAVPQAYSVDAKIRENLGIDIPLRMYANDQYGDCVIAGRANQTVRFEALEQRSLIDISDDEVTAEYFAESGGRDTGLVVLDSLNRWRSQGWTAGGKTYAIDAFTVIEPNHHNVMSAIFQDCGVGMGIQLPVSAQEQFTNGQPWEVSHGFDGARGSWGGHYVTVESYNHVGPVCLTWEKRQQMTWSFVDAYADEAYAILDARNRWQASSANWIRITSFLSKLGGYMFPWTLLIPYLSQILAQAGEITHGALAAINWTLVQEVATPFLLKGDLRGALLAIAAHAVEIFGLANGAKAAAAIEKHAALLPN